MAEQKNPLIVRGEEVLGYLIKVNSYLEELTTDLNRNIQDLQARLNEGQTVIIDSVVETANEGETQNG